MTYTIAECTVNKLLMMDRGCQNTFVKLVHLVGFVIKKFKFKFSNKGCVTQRHGKHMLRRVIRHSLVIWQQLQFIDRMRNCSLPYVSKNQSEELPGDRPERFSIFKIKFAFDFNPKPAESTAHLNSLLS